MSLTAGELADVCDELRGVLAGQPVQKIVQPDRETVLLGFARAWLLVSASARLGRLHLVDGKPPGTGEAAPAFCMLLRKELTGARLQAIEAVPGERACELRLLRGGGVKRLRLFLFGKAAQLQLVDGEERVLGHIGPAQRLHPSLPPPRAPSERELPSRFAPGPGLSARIVQHFERSGAEEARAAALGRARAQLEAQADKQRRLLTALGNDLARAEAAADKRKLGDLLLAHLHEVPRGARAVALPDDFSGGPPVEITLDPARSPRENAERFYKEHKRLSRARASIEERIAEVRARLARAEAALADEKALLVLESRPPAQPARPSARREGRTPPYREFRASTGTPILVGRGADRNDELTFKVARGSDLWLHSRDVPGAHVIVPLPAGVPVDEQTLLDAATLAAHHSNARGEAQVDVGYTLRKHVRKPPKSRPGTVTHSGLKTIRVRLEPERLQRLLASLRRDGD